MKESKMGKFFDEVENAYTRGICRFQKIIDEMNEEYQAIHDQLRDEKQGETKIGKDDGSLFQK